MGKIRLVPSATTSCRRNSVSVNENLLITAKCCFRRMIENYKGHPCVITSKDCCGSLYSIIPTTSYTALRNSTVLLLSISLRSHLCNPFPRALELCVLYILV